MTLTAKVLCALTAAALMTGCDAPTGLETKSLAKGAPIGVRALVAQNKGQVACTEYRASSNSCASLITSRISGNTLISSEVGAVRSPTGTVDTIEVITRASIKGDQACVRASGISLGKTTVSPEAAEFILGFTKQLVASKGSVCGSYFKAAQGYVVTSRGADGSIMPPGDTAFRYGVQNPSLRAQ